MLLIYAMIIKAIIILLLSVFIGFIFLGIDRKIAARFQSRVGPPIIQPFRDFIKLMQKQTIIPENSLKWLFNFAPVLALISSLMLILYIPFLGTPPLLSGYGDLILVLFILILPALAYVLAGFSSGNPYASVGSQRKMVMMASIEFPLAIILIAMVWKLNITSPNLDSFSFLTFMQNPPLSLVGPLGLIGVLILALTALFMLCAELIKSPFDAPEADTEIASGILVDYSGRNLALFMLADAAKLTAFISLIIALFFPCQLSSFLDITGFALLGNILFFMLKFFIIAFLGLTFIRIIFARLKITQLVSFFWVLSLASSLLGFLLIMIDVII